MTSEQYGRIFPWLMVAATIALTVYGQLMLKWEVGRVVQPPFAWAAQLPGVIQLLLRPGVISAFAAAFGASLCWMLALQRLQLSQAYPFMAFNFVFVSLLATMLFQEAISATKAVGLGLIVIGIILIGIS